MHLNIHQNSLLPFKFKALGIYIFFLSVNKGTFVAKALPCTSSLTEVCCAGISCLVMSDSLRPHGFSPLGSSVHGNPPGKHTGVGCHALLQRIF